MAARTSRNCLLLLRESAGVLLSGKRPYSKLSYFIQTQQRLSSSSHPMGNLHRALFSGASLGERRYFGICPNQAPHLFEAATIKIRFPDPYLERPLVEPPRGVKGAWIDFEQQHVPA